MNVFLFCFFVYQHPRRLSVFRSQSVPTPNNKLSAGRKIGQIARRSDQITNSG